MDNTNYTGDAGCAGRTKSPPIEVLIVADTMEELAAEARRIFGSLLDLTSQAVVPAGMPIGETRPVVEPTVADAPMAETAEQAKPARKPRTPRTTTAEATAPAEDPTEMVAEETDVPVETAPAAVTISVDTLRDVLKKVQAAHPEGVKGVRELLTEYGGVPRLADVPVEAFAACVKAAEAFLAQAKG